MEAIVVSHLRSRRMILREKVTASPRSVTGTPPGAAPPASPLPPALLATLLRTLSAPFPPAAARGGGKSNAVGLDSAS